MRILKGLAVACCVSVHFAGVASVRRSARAGTQTEEGRLCYAALPSELKFFDPKARGRLGAPDGSDRAGQSLLAPLSDPR